MPVRSCSVRGFVTEKNRTTRATIYTHSGGKTVGHSTTPFGPCLIALGLRRRVTFLLDVSRSRSQSSVDRISHDGEKCFPSDGGWMPTARCYPTSLAAGRLRLLVRGRGVPDIEASIRARGSRTVRTELSGNAQPSGNFLATGVCP
jgi:hypothetical protein